MKQYSLEDLRAFVAVVEAGTFRKAAIRLHSSAASVSRRVAGLERALGVKLIARTTRTLSVTDEGQRYYLEVRGILSALMESEDRLVKEAESPSGHLRMAASISFGVCCLAPLVPLFLEEYPQISLDLILDDHNNDLHAEGYDLALRIGVLRDSSSLVATKICDIEGVFCAAPDYLAQYGEPQSVSDLAAHDCLHYNLVSWRREWNLPDTQPEPRGRLASNNGHVLAQAAIEGKGILATPRYIVANALKRGELKQVLQTHPFVSLSMNVVRPSRQYTPQKVRVMIEFLRAHLGSDQASA